IPIVCVGEGLDIRKEGTHVPYTLEQVQGSLRGLPSEQLATVVIAYEPVWAIGTGEVATPDDAQEVCGAIRRFIAEERHIDIADAVRIQYGGSVNAGNVADIMAMPDVDGCLVGGASLKAEDFAKIATFYA
ncbi:MAG: triose-phosphate isomerase, partial [Propionibacteriaceae bacterium]|nr:triose-phosphate isomerase [Propionibacteriaceae bacterium]